MIVGLLAAIAVAFSGSGALRVSSAKARLDTAARKYDEIMFDLEEVRKSFQEAIKGIGIEVIRSIRTLKRANRMLRPVGRGFNVPGVQNRTQFENLVTASLDRSQMTISSYNQLVAAGGLGFGLGSAAAVGTWTVVSAFGHASTGAAIAGLYGAAHTSATLAAIGGGSLAAGGAGMAGGVHALAGVVLLPVAAIAGYVAHAQANEINEKAEEVEEANRRNANSLGQLREHRPQFELLERRVSCAADELEQAVQKVNRQLFRYGALSRLHRLLRRTFGGGYYTPDDEAQLDQLLRAIHGFLEAIGVGPGKAAHPPSIADESAESKRIYACRRCAFHWTANQVRPCQRCGNRSVTEYSPYGERAAEA